MSFGSEPAVPDPGGPVDGHPIREHVVVVHAHPDDESIVSGLLLADLVRRGSGVTLVTATRGELGEVIPPELADLEGSPELAGVREQELARAMAALGVLDHRFLGDPGARASLAPARRYTDSGMRWGENGWAEPLEPQPASSLCAAPFDEVVEDLAFVLDDVSATEVVSYEADGGYGHPDHVRVHQVARRAATILGIPFSVIVADGTVEDSDVVVGAEAGTADPDAAALFDAKRAALGAHRTQLEVRGGDFRLSSGPFRPIATIERFRRLAPAAAAEEKRTGGLLDSRPARLIGALVLGAVIGAITTAVHRTILPVAGVAVPVGIILGTLALALVVAGLRTASADRLPSLMTALGAFVMIALFTVPSSGGSILIAGDVLGTSWTIVPTVVVALVVVWPRIPARAAGRRDAPARGASSVLR